MNIALKHRTTGGGVGISGISAYGITALKFFHGLWSQPPDIQRQIIAKIDPDELASMRHEIQVSARSSFWFYRVLVSPHLIQTWWQQHAAFRLHRFYNDIKAGRRPKLGFGAPPQHGKSHLLRDFNSWVAGLEPDWHLVFGSYSEELGVEANLYIQRLMQGVAFKNIFPHLRVSTRADKQRTDQSVISFAGHRGTFRNTTVRGAITGFGLDMGTVDDPIKGRDEARSKTIRDKTWGWLVDDVLTRLSDHAGMVMIQTRWHVDDPTGRMIERFPDIDVLAYQAIATPNDWSVQKKLRGAGEALFKEHKSLEFLLERKRERTEESWQALYQQAPFISGGGMIKIENIRQVRSIDMDKVRASVRYWDKAGTADGGAYTAGVLMHRMQDGTYVIDHVSRGQWSVKDREDTIKRLAKEDKARCKNYRIGVEQEPGSGGKESIESTVRNLAGYRVVKDKVTGAKEVRAEPFAAMVENNQVSHLPGKWVTAFMDEAEAYPNGTYLDQVDAAAGAFNTLAQSSYDTSMSWVG